MKTFYLLKFMEGSRTFMVNPQSVFNMWEKDTEYSKMVARISSMKLVQEDQFLSRTRRLKTKLTRSFSGIEERDYLIFVYQVNVAYGILKCRKIFAHRILHTLTAKQCVVCVTTGKKNLARFWEEVNVFFNRIVTGDELWCHYHIMTSKQSSLI